MEKIALIGYGEVGRIFGAALAGAGAREVRAYDPRARPAADGVLLAANPAEAVAGCGLVVSAVTAAETLNAARQVDGACMRDALFLDVNSASPRTKADAAAMLARGGVRYVEAAVIAAVPPHGIRVPMLLGGPHAAAALPLLSGLGFNPTVGAAEYGTVSAIKLCRSVMVKGLEALMIESLLAARRYGVEREVLASLAESYPGMDWERQASYSWRRVVEHGARRAEEMREAAATVAGVKIEPHMAAATAEVQAWVAGMRAAGIFDAAASDAPWRALADLVPKRG